jgi:hypothetical protein
MEATVISNGKKIKVWVDRPEPPSQEFKDKINKILEDHGLRERTQQDQASSQ